jgi:hypothetical protein
MQQPGVDRHLSEFAAVLVGRVLDLEGDELQVAVLLLHDHRPSDGALNLMMFSYNV